MHILISMGKYGKVKRFFMGAGMFALIGTLAKLIGAFYRIPLTNIMGAEGIGLYQMVFPLYTVFLTATSGGLPAAVSKVTAAYNAANDRKTARRTLYVALVSTAVLSLIASAVIFFGSRKIAFIQGNTAAAVVYPGIAPSVAIVGIISCLRGYYQGSHNMLPSAMSQLVEQVMKMVLGLFLCMKLMPYGVQYAALGAVLGVTLSEAAALLLLVLQYLFTRYKQLKKSRISLGADFETALDIAIPSPVRRKSLLHSIYKIALPVTLGSLVIPITQVIDSILVINILSSVLGAAEATARYGLLNGPVGSLINMPVAVTTAISAALLPKISGAVALGKDPSFSAENALKFSLMIALPSCLGLAFFSKDILTLLYSSSVTGELIAIGAQLLSAGAVTVVYMSVIQVATAVLQGTDKAYLPAVNLLIGAVIKVIITAVMLKFTGILGAVAASVTCYAVTAVLDSAAMKKVMRFRPNPYRTALCPLISAAAAVGIGYLLKLTLMRFIAPFYALIAGLALSALLYITLIILLKGFTADDVIKLRTRQKGKGEKKRGKK